MDIIRKASEKNSSKFKQEHQKLTFSEYLELVKKNPGILRNSYQRMADMILRHGFEKKETHEGSVVHYKFFEDPFTEGKDAIFGIDQQLMKIVEYFQNGAKGLGAEKRILLLHGPVGSSKSSIARLLKRGLENYSSLDEGAMYTFEWIDKDGSDILGGETVMSSPMNEEPLKLLPEEFRREFISTVDSYHYTLKVKGQLNPSCRFILNEYLKKYEGDLEKVLHNHVRVKRLILSEKNRLGIGTFQPKDEKNQDSTELTGDINYRKIAKYGSDSDPRAFNFDGEFNIANRGMIEFIEMLKLDVAFLYDLLGASQEQSIKPKKFAQTDIDEVILGHTNEPEFRKLQSNEFMEALRDRTVKIDIPYITKVSDEERIYRKDFESSKDLHIAPHTIEIASLWSVLTRLEDPKNAGLDVMQKLKLYDGKPVPGYNKENLIELKQSAEREGLEGISPRYIQDKISNSLIQSFETKCLSPFKLIVELESGLKSHVMINSKDQLEKYKEALEIVREELDSLLKKDIREAISMDDGAMQTLCSNYVDNVKAYSQREKIRNKYSNKLEEPDERFMRTIEEKIDIPESRKDDFRRELMNHIGAIAIEGKTFTYESNDRLKKALDLKLFDDKKDQIKLTTMVSKVVDKETQAKIDVIKDRLMTKYGYCEQCATDSLQYVSNLMAKGDER